MLISKDKWWVPDRCPSSCPGLDIPFSQNGLCAQCPVLMCANHDGVCCLDAEDFDAESAESWSIFFGKIVKR